MDGAQRLALERYLDEMYAWTGRINLTAVTREDAWGRHIEESLRLGASAGLAAGAAVCDLGSGAGLPGIPVAVVRRDVRVVLCESDRRRAAFLTHVAGLLDLDNVTVAVERAEHLGRRDGMREGFDVVLSRALAAPAALCELALPLVRPGGALLALVGDASAAAVQATVAARTCGGGVPERLADDVLRVPKVAPTPLAYPRRDGLPVRRPLG